MNLENSTKGTEPQPSLEWDLILDVKPVPKSRPRFSKFAIYTDKKTRNYEKIFRCVWKKEKIKSGPIYIFIIFCFKSPKKTTTGYPRADLDNLEKAVCDGLNGVAYSDDSQIIKKYSLKMYGEKDQIKIKITRV